jgi:hypothetical protein
VSHRWLGEHYEENEDPIGTMDLATFVLCFLPFFAAFFSAFLSAFFAIFRNLLCLTTIQCLRVSGPSLTYSWPVMFDYRVQICNTTDPAGDPAGAHLLSQGPACKRDQMGFHQVSLWWSVLFSDKTLRTIAKRSKSTLCGCAINLLLTTRPGRLQSFQTR